MRSRIATLATLWLLGCGLDHVGASSPSGSDASIPTTDAQPTVDASEPDATGTDAALDADGPLVDAGGLDAGTPAITITGGPYGTDAGACSGSGAGTSFKLTNQHGTTIDFYWINPSCAELPYGKLNDGANFVQGTYQNHVWRVRNDADKAILGEFVLTGPGPYDVVVK